MSHPDLSQLRAAVNNPGPQPKVHADLQRRHRAEWPALWRALDELLAEPQAAASNADVGRLRALIRLLWPDDITPQAKRLLEQYADSLEEERR